MTNEKLKDLRDTEVKGGDLIALVNQKALSTLAKPNWFIGVFRIFMETEVTDDYRIKYTRDENGDTAILHRGPWILYAPEDHNSKKMPRVEQSPHLSVDVLAEEIYVGEEHIINALEADETFRPYAALFRQLWEVK